MGKKKCELRHCKLGAPWKTQKVGGGKREKKTGWYEKGGRRRISRVLLVSGGSRYRRREKHKRRRGGNIYKDDPFLSGGHNEIVKTKTPNDRK